MIYYILFEYRYILLVKLIFSWYRCYGCYFVHMHVICALSVRIFPFLHLTLCKTETFPWVQHNSEEHFLLKQSFFPNGWKNGIKYKKNLSCIIQLKLSGSINIVYCFLKGKISKPSWSTSEHAFFYSPADSTQTILLSTWASSHRGTE